MTGSRLRHMLVTITIQIIFLLTDVEVRLPFRNGEVRSLLLLLPPHLDQILDTLVPLHLPLQQKHILPRNARIRRRPQSNLHTIRMRHQKLRLRSLQRVDHLFDIIRRTGARDFASNAERGVHCHGVPDAVLAEECDGVTFFEAIAFHESGAEVSSCFFHFEPVQSFFGDCVCVASELVGRETGYG
jgi:hypothetical protein